MTKPVVHYHATPLTAQSMVVGRLGHVHLIDHPNPEGLVSNTKDAWTSAIVSVGPEPGVFETQNSIYVPA